MHRKENQEEYSFNIIETAADESTNYDLTVVVLPGEEITINFIYKTVFENKFMSQLLRHYKNTLVQIVENMETAISEIEVLDSKDYEAIDVEEAFATGFPDTAITDIFEGQAYKYPNSIALQFLNERYTYEQVDKLANRIANTLLEKDVKTENIVGILMEKSAKAIITALGILKAGAAYMPLDPDYPSERLEFMVSDSNAKAIVTAGNDFGINMNCPVVDIDYHLSDNSQKPDVEVTAENLAYIIYTSGTTGKPKGAMIFHRNVVRLFFNDDCIYDFTEKDVWVMFHSFCFDFSVWEMYGALLFGGKLIILPKNVARDTFKFLDMLYQEQVTVLNQTPSAFNSLSLQLEQEPDTELSLRYLIFGGEKLHPAVLKFFHNNYPACKIVNMYGITETTVHVTYKEIGEHEIQENVSDIGIPIPTLGLALVDSRLKPVPMGMPGEILVWGQGVCRGYLNRAEQTEKKFINYKKNDREFTVYRSGDAGRFIPGGLEYLGRIDQQVKIRGHRIELDEIISVILKNNKIEDSVVIVDSDKQDNNYIVAYYQEKQEITPRELRKYAEIYLPSYMIPAYFIPIKEIPLNANGKVDKKALPKPVVKADISKYVKPENDMQQYIAGIWEEVLEYVPVGLEDNYFEIGGDSIKVIKMLSRFHADGYHFEVADLFAHPTIGEFFGFIKINRNKYSQETVSGKMELTPIQRWLVRDEGVIKEQYNQAIMLHSEDKVNIESLKYAVKQMVIHHDGLRSLYVKDKMGTFMRICSAEEFEQIEEIRIEHLEGLSTEEASQKRDSVCDEEERAITLSSSKLYRQGCFMNEK